MNLYVQDMKGFPFKMNTGKKHLPQSKTSTDLEDTEENTEDTEKNTQDTHEYTEVTQDYINYATQASLFTYPTHTRSFKTYLEFHRCDKDLRKTIQYQRFIRRFIGNYCPRSWRKRYLHHKRIF